MADINKTIKDLDEQIAWIQDNDFHKFPGWGHAVLAMKDALELLKEQRWIPVTERLPENAKHKGAFCPRYRVLTKWGETVGWYNPDKECWFILVWILCDDLIDFKRGDNPYLYKEIPGANVVTHWQPIPKGGEAE